MCIWLTVLVGMAPGFLAGSYQRYKSDTNVFTAWLKETATDCGYQSPRNSPFETSPFINSNGDLKSQSQKKDAARKAKNSFQKDQDEKFGNVDSSGGAKPVVQTWELVKQAETVAACGKVKVPRVVVRVLERAIRTRKRYAVWFQMSDERDEERDEAHLHFIRVLEKALSILTVALEIEDVGRETKNGKRTELDEEAVIDEFKNRFAGLTIENGEDFLDSDFTELKQLPKTTAQSSPSLAEKEKTKYHRMAECRFAVHCFFDDLHCIQEFLHETWKSFKAGNIDLVTAMITTTAAVDTVRLRERSLLDSAIVRETIASKNPSHEIETSKLGYQNLLFLFLSQNLPSKEKSYTGIPNTFDPRLATLFHEFFFIPTWQTLSKYLSHLQSPCPEHIPNLRWTLGYRPELLERAEMKKEEQEDEFLIQLLLDHRIQDRAEDPKYQVLDDFTMCYRQLKEGELNAWQVFISRVILDLQDILGDRIQEEYQKLGDAAKTVNDRLLCTSVGHERYKWPRGDETLPKLFSRCDGIQVPLFPLVKQELKKRFKSHGGEDPKWPEILQRIDKGWKTKGIDLSRELGKTLDQLDEETFDKMTTITPSEHPAFLHAHNPLYCGIQQLELALGFEHTGIIFANHHQSIYDIAHLYNAVRQTRLITKTWPQMDKFISIHKKPIFLGSLPTKDDELYKRFMLSMGVSPRHILDMTQKPAEKGRYFRKGMEKGPQLSDNQMLAVFRPFFEKKMTMEQCIFKFKSHIHQSCETSSSHDNEKQQQPPDVLNYLSLIRGPLSSKRSISHEFDKQRQAPTATELLTQIREHLPSAIAEIRDTKYIELTRICSDLLKRLRLTILVKLGIEYPLVIKGEDEVLRNLHMTMSVLDGASSVEHGEKPVRMSRRDHKKVQQFQIAADVIGEFLKKLEEWGWDLRKVKV